MKKLCTLFLCAALFSSMVLTGCNSGNGESSTGNASVENSSATEDSEKPSNTTAAEKNPEDWTGDISVASPSWNHGELETWLTSYYPNLNITLVDPVDSLATFLATKAAANDLPDIVANHYDDMPFLVSQGWVANIEESFANDPESEYVPKALTDVFRYNGDLYALPYNTNWNAIYVNLSLLEELNLSKPDYDWTFDEFVELAKSATTDTTAGITRWHDMDEYYMLTLDSDLWRFGYNPVTDQFDMTSGAFVDSIKTFQELRKIKGVSAEDLINQQLRDQGSLDDYQKKFGAEIENEGDLLATGLVLFDFEGTWKLHSKWSDHGFKWDLYPLPIANDEVGQRTPVHCEYTFITTTGYEKNPELSYEVAKFLSYGKEGSIHRLNEMQSRTDEDGNPRPSFYIPSTREPEVIEYFKSLEGVPEGVYWMFENLPDDLPRGDTAKGIPLGRDEWKEAYKEDTQKFWSGELDPAAVAQEYETRRNEAYEKARTELDAALSIVE